MTEEIGRARAAVERARDGGRVALISSGDAGVYGMAGLVFEVLRDMCWKRGDSPDLRIVPGMTAMNSCASLVGAPLVHDFGITSLSDLLTPWPVITRKEHQRYQPPIRFAAGAVEHRRLWERGHEGAAVARTSVPSGSLIEYGSIRWVRRFPTSRPCRERRLWQQARTACGLGPDVQSLRYLRRAFLAGRTLCRYGRSLPLTIA